MAPGLLVCQSQLATERLHDPSLPLHRSLSLYKVENEGKKDDKKINRRLNVKGGGEGDVMGRRCSRVKRKRKKCKYASSHRM